MGHQRTKRLHPMIRGRAYASAAAPCYAILPFPTKGAATSHTQVLTATFSPWILVLFQELDCCPQKLGHDTPISLRRTYRSCPVCGSTDAQHHDLGAMLLCGHPLGMGRLCNRGYHQRCLDPPLDDDDVPLGEFYCPMHVRH